MRKKCSRSEKIAEKVAYMVGPESQYRLGWAEMTKLIGDVIKRYNNGQNGMPLDETIRLCLCEVKRCDQ